MNVIRRCRANEEATILSIVNAPVDSARAAELLNAYWDIPERQIQTSVVLERP